MSPATRLRTGLALAAALLLLVPAAALGATATVSGAVTGGSLTLISAATASWSTISTGATQQPTFDLATQVVDATGSGAGWGATITQTDYTTGGATPHTLAWPSSSSSITTINDVCSAGATCTPATPDFSGGQLIWTIPSGPTAPTPVKYFNAVAGTGMGSTDLPTTIRVFVPGNAFAGVYTSILTLAVVSGP